LDVTSHILITRAAIDVLGAWQRRLLGAERENIVKLYSLYPDIWRWKENGDTHDNAVRYGHVSAEETRRYSVLPDGSPASVSAEPEPSAATTFHYIERSLDELAKRNIAGAAKYLGSFAHYLQDHGCAAHVPPDVLGNLLRLEPPPRDDVEFVSLRYLFENEDTPYEAHLEECRPQLLGRTPAEAVFRARQKFIEIERAKLRSVLPYLRALYRKDAAAAGGKRTADAGPRRVGETGACGRLIGEKRG